MSWVELKDALELTTGLSEDALHIYAALLIQVAAAFLTRRSLAHPLPWATVLGLALVNEWADIWNDAIHEQWETRATVHDVVNTMVLPTLLLLLARVAPPILRRDGADKRSGGDPGAPA